MKICFTAKEAHRESELDPRFGRCPYFFLVDSDINKLEIVENLNAQKGGGAGIQAGQLMSDKKIDLVVTGQVGPNAFDTLNAAGIQIVTGAQGKILEILKQYEQGELKNTKQATVDSHFGIKP
ncbi:MAG: NifB/NifX family molybdenum-iron cluster-binding protein [Spirochaetes bacterium]|nr:NifB/NifX family molybdenum-iron cluster-binding protein [Spirochaetota bacterium]